MLTTLSAIFRILFHINFWYRSTSIHLNNTDPTFFPLQSRTKIWIITQAHENWFSNLKPKQKKFSARSGKTIHTKQTENESAPVWFLGKEHAGKWPSFSSHSSNFLVLTLILNFPLEPKGELGLGFWVEYHGWFEGERTREVCINVKVLEIQPWENENYI